MVQKKYPCWVSENYADSNNFDSNVIRNTWSKSTSSRCLLYQILNHLTICCKSREGIIHLDTRHWRYPLTQGMDIQRKMCPHSELFWSTFGLNTGRYGVSFRIQSKSGQMRVRITPNTDAFYAVIVFWFWDVIGWREKWIHKVYNTCICWVYKTLQVFK